MIHSYPWYIADWRNSESRYRMDLAERGLYRDLLDFCYLEGSLPLEVVQLQRIASCTAQEFNKAWPKVESLFHQHEGRLCHVKVDEVRTKLEYYHDLKRKAGLKSGESRRKHSLNTRSNSRSTPVRTPVEPSPSPSLTTTTQSTVLPFSGLSSSSEVKIKNSLKLTTTNGHGKHKYASDRDELVALIETSTGRRPDLKLMRSISDTLELRGATVRAFIDDTEPRLTRLSNQPGEGFFLKQARDWGSESTAPAAPPEKAEERNAHGRCSKCNGSGKCGEEYCVCKLGKDLKVSESRPVKVPPGTAEGEPKARMRK